MKFKYQALLLFSVLILFGFTQKSKQKKVYQKQPKDMVYVPSGSYLDESFRTINIEAFWMQESEVSNLQYKVYLNHLTAKGFKDSVNKAYPDTALINHEFWTHAYFPFFEHPVFNDYPVVGLTRKQITGYSRWLTELLHVENPMFDMTCRLPTLAEWQYAAAGGRSNQKYDLSSNIINSKGSTLAHFFDGNMRFRIYEKLENAPDYYDPRLSKYSFETEKIYLKHRTKDFKNIKPKTVYHKFWMYGIPAPRSASFPNDYGLYGMSGNVAESVVFYSDTLTVGGSFKTSPEYCSIKYAKAYPFNASKPQTDVGFRLVCAYKKAVVN